MIRVTFHDSELTIATVHITPRWWERLLGDKERDSQAYLDRGHWFWSLTGQHVGAGVERKIWARRRSDISRLHWKDRVRVVLRADE